MPVYSICFSPTGGTKKVLKELTAAWSEVIPIDLSLPNQDYSSYRFDEMDLCIIAVPVFEGRVLTTALERLKKMRAVGARAILAAVFGNRAIDDALLELKDSAEEIGFSVIGAVGAVAQHSLLPTYGAGRPDEADCLQLNEFSQKLKSVADSGEKGEVAVPGNRPYIVIGNAPKIFPQVNGEYCDKCGLCTAHCPVSAISPEEPRQINADVCVRCLRCTRVCPTGAMAVDRETVQKVTKWLFKLLRNRKNNVLYL